MGFEVLGIATLTLSASLAWVILRLRRALIERDQLFRRSQRVEALVRSLEHSDDPVHVVDTAGRCVGLDISTETSPKLLTARLPAEARDRFSRRLAAAFEAMSVERMRVADGDRWLEVMIQPLRPSPSAPPVAIVQFHDSTEHERGQERLRKLANRSNAILRSSMDGFFVVGEDYSFVEVNDAFCRMTGYTGDELLAMKISDLEVRGQVSGGVPSHTRTGLHQFPTAHRHKNGQVIYLEISINVHHNDDGKVLVGFARDVTERKRAQEDFARLSRQHRLILDSAIEGIFGVDAQGVATFVNPAAAHLLDLRAGDLIGTSMHTRVCGAPDRCDDVAVNACRFAVALQSGRSLHHAEGSFRRDADEFPVEYSMTPIYENTNVVGAVVVFRDVTERKRAEQERRALEEHVQQTQRLESLGLLAGGIAHDLNNMLVGILGNACLAQEQLCDTEGVGQRLQRIIGACERGSKTIAQILAYSGHITCDPAPLDANAFVDDLVELMRPNVSDAIELIAVTADDLPTIDADAGQLQQVLSNLIVNAAEAIGDRRGHIAIRTSRRFVDEQEAAHGITGQEIDAGEYVVLAVSDDGSGIAPERLPRIFEPFFSEKGAGRGLGLAAMLGIVGAHDGAVHVDSVVGRGTVFSVFLPALPDAPTLPAALVPAAPAVTDATILVIDDDDDVRDVLRDTLESRELTVLTASGGAEGVELFEHRADEIDAVLLDMTMPGMSGDEVFRRITQLRPHTRVIIASGYTETSIAEQLGDGRPAAFLQKPFTSQALMECVHSVLRQQAARG
jgi:PAS domain S-box-containing protein